MKRLSAQYFNRRLVQTNQTIYVKFCTNSARIMLIREFTTIFAKHVLGAILAENLTNHETLQWANLCNIFSNCGLVCLKTTNIRPRTESSHFIEVVLLFQNSKG